MQSQQGCNAPVLWRQCFLNAGLSTKKTLQEEKAVVGLKRGKNRDKKGLYIYGLMKRAGTV